MTPEALDTGSFDRYSPSAKAIALRYLPELKRLPVAVVASFLDQISAWDWRFPAERRQLRSQLDAFAALPLSEANELTAEFSRITLPAEITKLDWVNAPGVLLRRLTPYLWSSQQIDRYRTAAAMLIDRLSMPDGSPETAGRRLVIVTLSDKLAAAGFPVFVKLRKHGLHATQVDGRGADESLTKLLQRRTIEEPILYAHWLVASEAVYETKLDGVAPAYLSYQAAEPVRRSVLKLMERAMISGSGPEVLRSQLAALTPADCEADRVSTDSLLQHFIVDLFANGSGTQIYSTSFMQWAGREILRRAQPKTLIAKIGPRVRQRPFNESVTAVAERDEPDYPGSLVDGDLAAYYTWLESERLPGADRGVFLAWAAGHRQAVLIGPSVPKNVSTNNWMTLPQLLETAGVFSS